MIHHQLHNLAPKADLWVPEKTGCRKSTQRVTISKKHRISKGGAPCATQPRAACPTGSQADMGCAASWITRSSTSRGRQPRPGVWLPAAASPPKPRPLRVRPVGLRPAMLPPSSNVRAAALKASGQWWWVAGLQLPPLATNNSLQGPRVHASICLPPAGADSTHLDQVGARVA